MFHSTKRLMADSSTSSAECGPIHSAACGFRRGTRIRKTGSRLRWEAPCWDTSGAVTQGAQEGVSRTSGPGRLRSAPHRTVTGRVHRSASLAVIFFSVVTSGSSPALGSKITQEANLWSHTSNAFGRPSERPTVETSPHVRAGRSRLRPHRERRAGEADPSIILTGFDVLRGSA